MGCHINRINLVIMYKTTTGLHIFNIVFTQTFISVKACGVKGNNHVELAHQNIMVTSLCLSCYMTE